jgi:hypothetical protein
VGRAHRHLLWPGEPGQGDAARPRGLSEALGDGRAAVQHDLGADPRLRFEREGSRHSIEIYWDVDWNHWSWYVNLQTPVALNGRFVDTTDCALDWGPLGLPRDWHVV